ncbi:hypothetical protein HMPREF9446_01742 [Bacteroides fluxus YIT 12057]|uniref:Uncharacterized protein n=1 Tax=Bacteroides fluxus YIT 12057 TaxID=763034 RepID=F3PSN4_9BACE|nr:hypothetical protein HMPREF9446_01742 [Bacteroides fluxus YIT 12057]
MSALLEHVFRQCGYMFKQCEYVFASCEQSLVAERKTFALG